MADKVKLGIIGYGHIGSQHGRAIRDGKCPQVNLTAVCDIDPARLELAKKTNGEDIQTFTDASEAEFIPARARLLSSRCRTTCTPPWQSKRWKRACCPS